MADYVFVLGRDFQLSILEIESYLIARRIDHKVRSFNKKAAMLSFSSDIDAVKMVSDLGGTIKIARVINSIDELRIPNADKINYSIAEIESKKKNALNNELKKIFKSERMKAYMKRGDDTGLSPSDFARHGIFEKGFEIVLYKDVISVVVAVFNPNDYELRDKRPYLDRKKLTSIRLAKILVNLSQARENETLLDPFCGVATILQEALLVGINAIGMDTDAKSVYYAKKNLSWLQNKYGFKSSFMLINKSAVNASSYIEKVDAIATEPYLGPYLKRMPLLSDAKRTAAELSKLYLDFLNDARIILKKGKAAIIIPRFKTREQVLVRINFLELAKKAGFRMYNPFPGISMPVLYDPKGKKLQREIYVLERI